MNYIYILLIVELLLFLLAYVFNGHDILSPSTTMCIMFILGTSFAISNVEKWKIEYGFDSFFIISTGILVFVVAEILCNVCQNKFKIVMIRNKKNNLDPVISTIQPIEPNLILMVGLVIFNLIIIRWYVVSIRDITGNVGTGLAYLASSYRSITLHSTIGDDLLERISPVLSQMIKIVVMSGYVAAYIMVNNIVAKHRSKKNLVLLTILFLSIIPSLLVAGRIEILRLIGALLVYYYLLLNIKNQWHKNFSWKFIRIGMIAIVIGIPLFYFSLNFVGRSTELEIFDYIAKYIGGGIRQFDSYTKNPVPRNDWGEESLMGVRSILYRLGANIHVGDTNLEFRNSGMLRTNIYTFFRRPYHDFGYVGMLVFTFLVSWMISSVYYKKIKYKILSKKMSKWIIIYGFLFFWVVISPMDQESFTYLSLNTVIKIMIVWILDKFLVQDAKQNYGKDT